MVRLKVCAGSVTVIVKASFQFHSGSIKRVEGHKAGAGSGKFQFHSGSIKSVHNLHTQPRQIVVSIP